MTVWRMEWQSLMASVDEMKQQSSRSTGVEAVESYRCCCRPSREPRTEAFAGGCPAGIMRLLSMITGSRRLGESPLERKESAEVACFVLTLTVVGLMGAEEEETASEEFQREFAKASCDFGLDILKNATKEPDENLLFSPSSISIVLAILQQGAKENTAAQLEKVLHLSAQNSVIGYSRVIESLRREKTNMTLEWANRAFVVPGFDLKKNFLRTIEDSFNATFEELDFKTSSPANAATIINDWVKEATHDNIQNLVDASALSPNVVMVMVNAVYFKSVWDSPFHKYKTRHDTFQPSPEVKLRVPFMRQAGRFAAGEDAEVGIKWVELPFKDDNFSMIFVLPMKKHGLSQVMEKLSGSRLLQAMGSKASRRVKLAIPKFRLAKKVSLVETLRELGLTDIFTKESNLRGISSSEEPLVLSHLIHQADVEIDEDGSTAAAATYEIAQTLSFEWFTDEMQFRADHPFLFFIVDKSNQVPIFAGKIANPDGSLPKV